MYTSDYLYGYVQRQHHQELMGDAAERRMARMLRVVRKRPSASWWQRLAASLRPAPNRTAARRPAAGLQSARS